jgi:hypothetical protein
MTNLKKITEQSDIAGILDQFSPEQVLDSRKKWEGRAGSLFRAVTYIENTTSGFFQFLVLYPHLDDCINGYAMKKKYYELKLRDC